LVFESDETALTKQRYKPFSPYIVENFILKEFKRDERIDHENAGIAIFRGNTEKVQGF
jgi:hypothetical protein